MWFSNIEIDYREPAVIRRLVKKGGPWHGIDRKITDKKFGAQDERRLVRVSVRLVHGTELRCSHNGTMAISREQVEREFKQLESSLRFPHPAEALAIFGLPSSESKTLGWWWGNSVVAFLEGREGAFHVFGYGKGEGANEGIRTLLYLPGDDYNPMYNWYVGVPVHYPREVTSS